MSKKKIQAFIHFNWYWYLLIVILMCFIFYSIFDIAKKPSYDERIVVFVGIKYIDSDEMEEVMMLENTEIREIFVDFSDPNDMYFSTTFSTRGLIDSDILILSEEELNRHEYEDMFAAIEADYIEGYIDGDINYLYGSNNEIYGIEVTNQINEFASELTGKYYAVFSKDSNKVGKINDETNNDYAVLAFAKLFGE